jgi:hypothetical protein
VLEQMQRRLDRRPEAMTLRRSTVEDVFGTLKQWMGTTHFLTRRLEHVTEAQRLSGDGRASEPTVHSGST